MIHADLELVLQPRKILYTFVPSIIALPTKTFMDFNSHIWYVYMCLSVCFAGTSLFYNP